MEIFEQQPQQWTGIPADKPGRPSPVWLAFAIVIGMAMGGALVYFTVDTSPETASTTSDPTVAATPTTSAAASTTTAPIVQSGSALDIAYQTTYPVEGSPNGVVALENGSAEITMEGSATPFTAKVADAFASDLDGDGVDDAVVMLVSNGGGSGSFYSVYGVFADPDQTVISNEISLGDRITVDGFTADSGGGIVKVRYRDHSESVGLADDPDLLVASNIQILRSGAVVVMHGSIPIADTADPQLSESSKITTGGLGPVRIGMSVAEATKAAGRVILTPTAGATAASPDCAFAVVDGLPGVAFMVNNGVIRRVDIDEGTISTSSGAHIGSTEQEIKDLFPGIITVSDHAYVEGGHYLTLTPTAENLKDDRVVFETDGQVVTSYRAGKVPEVGYIEGCA